MTSVSRSRRQPLITEMAVARAIALLLLAAGMALVLWGVALIFLPGALILGGLGLAAFGTLGLIGLRPRPGHRRPGTVE